MVVIKLNCGIAIAGHAVQSWLNCGSINVGTVYQGILLREVEKILRLINHFDALPVRGSNS